MAAMGYELYTVRHSQREIVRTVSGWTGAAIGARLAAQQAAAVAIIGGQPGPQAATPEEIITVPLAALLGGILGGIAGGLLGTTAYDIVESFTLEHGHSL